LEKPYIVISAVKERGYMAKRMARFTITDSQMYLITFVVGLIIGVIVFRTKNDILYPAMCLCQELRADKLRRSEIVSANLLSYVAVERLKEYGLLFLTQITIFRRIAACGYCVVCGIACAILEAFYVQEYALKGMIIFAATLLPHYIFYVVAWYKLCTFDLPLRQINKETLTGIAGIFGITIVLVFIGIIGESILNVWLLKKIF